MKKKKESGEHKEKNQIKLTVLSDKEAEQFLGRYEQIIILESNKRSELPGIGKEDMMQMCRERLLRGFRTFDSNKSSEKTWATHVIKKTLNGIWRKSLSERRVNTFISEEGDIIPVRDISIEDFSEIPSQQFQISNDCRPVPTYNLYNAFDFLEIKESIEFMKENLSEEAFSLVAEEILPGIVENIKKNPKRKRVFVPKKASNIWSILSGEEENEIQILKQIADFFISNLGFSKQAIIKRERTVDVPM